MIVYYKHILNQFFIYNTADFIKIVKKFILVFFK
jgi:hypothetical protein